MNGRHHPSLGDDATNLTTIGASALFAAMITGSFLPTSSVLPSRADLSPPEAIVASLEVDAAAGADRIYGRVVRTDGSERIGYLRWNGREVSWADVMAATRPESRAILGVRFGHVARLEPVDTRLVLVTLKSGETVEVAPLVGRDEVGPRSLTVESRDLGVEDVPWADVASVDLLPEPVEEAPSGERLQGTVVTRSGQAFTGLVSLASGEIYTTDALADRAGRRLVHFYELASLESREDRAVGDGLTATLLSGEEVPLPDTPPAITVSDPDLGSVLIPGDQLREIRFHVAETPAGYERFGGGAELFGTVVTENGEEITGQVRWDLDEASTWATLEGESDGIQYQVELAQITRVSKFRLGATVELTDGRSLYLIASNDVNWSNHGIEVRTGDDSRTIDWDDFAELMLDAQR